MFRSYLLIEIITSLNLHHSFLPSLPSPLLFKNSTKMRIWNRMCHIIQYLAVSLGLYSSGDPGLLPAMLSQHCQMVQCSNLNIAQFMTSGSVGTQDYNLILLFKLYSVSDQTQSPSHASMHHWLMRYDSGPNI